MSIYKPHGKWIITDDDWVQVRRQFYEGCDHLWQLAQIRENCDGRGNYWHETISQVIDLNDYEDEEIKDMLNTYGYDEEDFYSELDPLEAKGQLAEMFFESLDDWDVDRHAILNDAIAFLERWTGLDLSKYKD